jgi:transcriptional regulator with XRE-family HTH domain
MPVLDGMEPPWVAVAFGWRLREVRAERGVSRYGLARRTGLHPTAVGRFERGVREPRVSTVLRLARGLGVEPRVLLDGLAVKPGQWGEA